MRFQTNSQTLIDKGFDVLAISELSHRERAAFKAIYSMNKWWARRSSSVFRGILLGLSQPLGTPLMNAFYNDHRQDPGVSETIILDPFMGGGTTIVEALRLGYKAVGVDLNPLSWFIVRNETTQTNLVALEAAFDRIKADVANVIQADYSTRCPCCQEIAESVYTFWVKVAPCTHQNCEETVPLFRNYIIGQRRGYAPIHYHPVQCEHCMNHFDWEVEAASPAPEYPDQWQPHSENKETTQPWSYARSDQTPRCPHCAEFSLNPIMDAIKVKKVSVFALMCPECRIVFSCRGPVPESVQCPACANHFAPHQGTTERGKFICPNGHENTIIEAVNHKGSTEPLPFQMYAIEGFCPRCANRRESELEPGNQLAMPGFDDRKATHSQETRKSSKQTGHCLRCAPMNHKFFKRVEREDLARYEQATTEWERLKQTLPWPHETIQNYEKTNRLIIHNYRYWYQLFNPRQLLSLTRILAAITEEPDQAIKEALVAAFLGTLEHQNMLNIYYIPYAQSAGAFGRHDFHPKVTTCEGNPWGSSKGRGTWLMAFSTVLEGKRYLLCPTEARYDDKGRRENVTTHDPFEGHLADSFERLKQQNYNLLLATHDSRNLSFIPDNSVDHVVTDPPYADAVQYAELADFFYVWLRAALQKDHPERLASPETPKGSEIVENISRGQSQEDFHEGLGAVFAECHRILKPNGRLVFTFHHSKSSQWLNLLEALLNAGFELIATYPVKSEATESGNLVFHSNTKDSIAYDIIHVCRKAIVSANSATTRTVIWVDLQKHIQQKVADHVAGIRATNGSLRQLTSGDIRIMLWGECMALYSQHYGQVQNTEGQPVTLAVALEEATKLVETFLKELPK